MFLSLVYHHIRAQGLSPNLTQLFIYYYKLTPCRRSDLAITANSDKMSVPESETDRSGLVYAG